MKQSNIVKWGFVSVVLAALAVASAIAVGASPIVHGAMDQAKQQFLAQEKARQDLANRGPHAAKHPEMLPAASCPHPIAAGIRQFHMGPFRGGKNLLNEAGALSGAGVGYTLYTGALDDDPAQGVILVLAGTDPCTAAAGKGISYLKAFPTPTRHGAVKALGVRGDSLQFVTADGQAGAFDFVTGTYSP